MHPNAHLINEFYQAFQARDGARIAACYHPNAEFSDPIFTSLKGEQVGAMWRMLTESAKDLQLNFDSVMADDAAGRAHWEAHYFFSKTGRPVHNEIDTRFAFRDGKIIRHIDNFDLWRWAGMALGIKGKVMGWLPAVQEAIRQEASAGLERYMGQRQDLHDVH